jgi:hypothetical protein
VSAAPAAAARVLALKAQGLTDARVAALVGYSLSAVRRVQLRAAEAAAQAAPKPTERDLALLRGRLLARRKVARGEWVLPNGGAR